ncbi:MAG: protocatechuate 3,4-dioxygenase [Planctomycetota bacterium]|nr:intradiol ring-cleavage dioxygenase [Planctomycetaceae bacterium]MDQ3330766.1 protocatechuate 3,4-dioxygenase [Planctomycetota bacterium]
MDLHRFTTSRRVFLGTLGAAYFTTRGLFAEELARTPAMTEGPFYPDKLPLDTDNDLIILSDSLTPAVGEITQLTGRVLDATGAPIKDALIEIWQCDANAVYLHTSDSSRKQSQQDKHFQGYGTFETASDGGFRFRTIKPVPYPGRPSPHIHYKITRGGRELLTSQIFIEGHEGNRTDGVFAGLRDPLDRALCSTEFKPIADSKSGELAAKFDIVVGRTPDERTFER